MEPISGSAAVIILVALLFFCLVCVFYLAFVCEVWRKSILRQFVSVQRCNWTGFWRSLLCILEWTVVIVESLVWALVSAVAYVMVVANLFVLFLGVP
jgi:hypothetical protein